MQDGLQPLKTPYFISDNRAYFDTALGFKKTIAQQAAERHAARTPQETQDIQRRWDNNREYHRLIADPDYTDVEYDPKSGGMKARHIGHHLDPNRGYYETDVQNIAYKHGEKVILGNEPKDAYKQKSTEGTWNDNSMEIASAETATPKNIRSALKHCVSKPGAEVAVIYFPNGADLSDIEQGLKLFNGLQNAKGNQWRQFTEIVFISPDGIIKKLRP